MLAVFIFILGLCLAFYIPGNLLLYKQKLGFIQKLAASFATGIMLWAFQGYLFGFLKIRWATYLYLGFFVILQIYLLTKKKLNLPSFHIPARKQIIFAILVFISIVILASPLLFFWL